MQTLAELLRWRASRHPDICALREPGRSLTYAELERSTTEIANGLIAAGIQPGDRVAILDKNSVAYVELIFALAKCGAVAAPVNWRLTAREAAQVVGDANATLLVVGDELRNVAEPLGVPLQSIDALPHAPGDDPHRDREDDVVWQLYTSGTTGVPKGAMLTNANLFSCMAGILLEAPELHEGSVALVAMPLYHIGGCGWAAAMMFAGATMVIVRDIVPDELVRTIVDERVECAFLVPAVLLFISLVPGVEEADFSNLQRMFYGASPITPELLARCIELLGCRFTQVYGLTETTGAFTALRHEDHVGELLLSCGRAGLGVEIKIVDPMGREAAPGETGELIIRSPQVMRGYWGREDDTADSITDGWFHTGDAASIDSNGFVFLRDRVKDMIISGGENVYPVEVEAVLAEHPGVADVAVFGVPDDRWGETVKAVVVRRDGSDITAAGLIDFTRDRLAGYKRPTSIDFVEVIPRNPTGKVLKRQLREPYWAGRERRVAGSGSGR
jgi:long-chain acyl-CoA synthetase